MEGKRDASIARGDNVTIKQTDFGIKPVSVGGGLVRVKNEVELDFRIRVIRSE